MSPQARMAAGKAPLPDAGVSAGSDADAGAGPFVLNLTSSTTPMALVHPEAPELKRFSFFVSRRREDNRERFRLHMGYFATLAEAEEWLNVIRDLYPGAWAGEAPGKKLRARAAAAELAKQLPPPPSAAAAAAARPAAPVSAPVAKSAAARPAAPAMPAAAEFVVPTLQAAPALPSASAASAASAAPMLEAVAQAAAALAAAAKTVAGAQAGSPPISFTYAPAPIPVPNAPSAAAAKAAGAAVQRSAAQIASQGAPVAGAPAGAPNSAASKASATPAQVTATRPASAPPANAGAQAAGRQAPPAAPRAPGAPQVPAAASAPAAQQPGKGKKPIPNALTEGSNVREVMASLDETGETRQMRIPAGLRAPAAPAAPVAPKRAPAPAQNARGSAPEQRVAPPASRAPSTNSVAADSMSDTQVLRMLETRKQDDAEKGSDDANSGISMLKPDDTQTRRALKEAVIDNAPVSFAVQLQWSVQPVDLASVPPLAIFSAYTLYTVEGSREGRKWYGLRLGFFSDAISAKQVAYYVRSEFNSVAVVPVSPAEKSRASDEETKAATGAFQRKNVEKKVEEFKLFDDEKLAANEAPKLAEPAPAAKPAANAPPGRGGSAPARKNKPLGRVRAKEQRSPKTLEETLEILGASDLEIDNGRGEVLNDTGVRHLRVEVQKNTPFAKLLDRISERVRKN